MVTNILFARSKVIFILYNIVIKYCSFSQVCSYCCLSRLVAFRAEIIRMISSPESEKNRLATITIWSLSVAPIVIHLSSNLLKRLSKTGKCKRASKTSFACSNEMLRFWCQPTQISLFIHVFTSSIQTLLYWIRLGQRYPRSKASILCRYYHFKMPIQMG